MVNTNDRPLNPIAAAAWDKRQHEKNVAAANEQSKRAAIKEVSTSYAMGKEARTGMMESGIAKSHMGGIVSGLVDTGSKRKGSGSW